MSEARPEVSVVLPAFNRGPVLARAIDSVLGQTFSGLEVIVVDDGSTDDTERRVAAIGDARLRYIRHGRNRGAAAARNTGVQAAQAPWLAFQDSDDEWLPDKLEKQMTQAHAASPPPVVYCGFVRRQGGALHYMPHSGIRPRQGNILPRLLAGNFVSTQTLLVRKDMLEALGGFDEKLPALEDWELAIRLAERHAFRLVDEPLVTVHHSADSLSGDNDARTAALALIFEKHAPLFDRFPGTRFRVLTGFGLLDLASGNRALAKRQFRSALSVRPRSVKGWGAYVFSWLIPALCGRLRGGRG